MRAVVDTNVIVSAAINPTGPPYAIVRAWRRGQFELVTSAELQEEIGRVWTRAHVSRLIFWSAEQLEEFRTALRRDALVVAPGRRLDIISADPSDNRVLEAAVEAAADYIVSGDHHLLELGEYEGIRIVTPARFAALLSVDLA